MKRISPPVLAHFRMSMIAAGLVIVAIGIQDLASPAGSTAAFASRLLMGLIFFAAAVPAGSTRDAVRLGAIRTALALVILLGAPAVIAGGGMSNPWFWFSASLPLYVALVLKERVTLAITTAAALTAFVVILAFQAAPVDGSVVGAWLLQCAFAVAFALWGIVLHERRIAAEIALRASAAFVAEERSHTERLATVGRMVAGVAHEINNPLAVVHANVSFLREEAAAQRRSLTPSEESDLLRDTGASAERIRILVRDMQAFTRRKSTSADCSVDAVVASSVRLARAGAAAEITVDIEGDGSNPRVAIACPRLEQALLNLLGNAADALRVGHVQQPRVVVSFATVGSEARIRIQDNGPGIPSDVLRHVFEPFFTTKEPGEGPGLGLSVAHEYVAHAGGRLTAANAPEGGALFEIALPLTPEPPTGDSPSSDPVASRR